MVSENYIRTVTTVGTITKCKIRVTVANRDFKQVKLSLKELKRGPPKVTLVEYKKRNENEGKEDRKNTKEEMEKRIMKERNYSETSSENALKNNIFERTYKTGT